MYQGPAHTHLTITSPHAATAAVVNIATGVVSLVEVEQHQQQQQQRQAESPPPPRAMGVQPWSPSPTPRQRPTASCAGGSLVEGTTSEQQGAKCGSDEAAEQNLEQNLERHLDPSLSLDQQLLGIWRTVQIVRSPRTRSRT